MIKSFFVLILISITTIATSQEFRTITGIGNNPDNTNWGAVGAEMTRVSGANYADGFQEIKTSGLPIARNISNKLFSQDIDVLEPQDLSDFVWLFGQFLDHDISLVETDEAQTSLLNIPADDETFDQSHNIFLSRNKYMPGTGDGPDNPRAYENHVTSFIDASMVYGSTEDRAAWLRSFVDGKMKVSISPITGKELLPWNTVEGDYNSDIDYSPETQMEDATRRLSKYFVAGDVRANENTLLLCLHTLFLREHNRLCDELKERYPSWDDENLYQRARKMVGAYIQAITYYEWLPSLGVYLPDYQGYNRSVNPAIFNEFSAAAFRIGHTMIDNDIKRMDNEGETVVEGDLELRDAFFQPTQLLDGGGIDAYFKGMGTQVMQEMDCKMIDDLRNFLFSTDSNVGLDLASINIFRGRERGLAGYNDMRESFGMTKQGDFDDITDSEQDITILKELYGDIDNIDAWVGMLSEKHVDDNAVFGELVMTIIKDQFRNLRDGDRFYFENDNTFSGSEMETIRNTTLHDIIMRNTNIELMQPNVFSAMPHMDIPNLVLEEITLEAVIYPNPVQDKTVVKIYSEEETTMTYDIMDETGRRLNAGNMVLYPGQDNYLELSFDHSYKRGLYNLVLQTEDTYKTLKLVKN